MKKLSLVLVGAVIVLLIVSYLVYAQQQQNHAPTVLATPNQLWPPNGKMIPIKLEVFCPQGCSRENPCPCCANWHIVSVTSEHEPLSTDDYVIDNSACPHPTLLLKSERLGNGNGRTYIITVEEDQEICCHPRFNTVTVTVPHDQGK